MRATRTLLALGLTFISYSAFTQCTQLNWQNPSFEGGPNPPPAHQLQPDWSNCNGTTSDTQPGNWGINLPATNGSQYIGLVAVPGWQETASQFISGCLTPGVTYTFTVDVAGQDDQSGSGSCPGNLVLWAGNPGVTSGSSCDFSSQVWTSPQITNGMGWTTMTVSFTPTQNFCSLTWQAINDPGCTNSTFSVQLDNLSSISPFSVTPNGSTNVSCFGGNNGTASIQNPSGGVAPYSIVWSPAPGAGQGTTSATGLIAGTYTCTVTDANGCSGSTSFTITQPSSFTVSLPNPGPSNCGSPVTLTATPSGGAGGNQFSWTPTGGNSATNTVTPSGNTTYTVTVTDANNCTATASTTVISSGSLAISAGADQSVCPGDPATLTVTGGGVNFAWTENGTPIGGNTASITVNPAATSTYIVHVDDGGGCSANDTVIVNVIVPGSLVINPAGPYCANSPATVLAANMAGGTWSGPGITNAATGAFNPATAGAGTHTITYMTPGSCGDTATVSIQVIANADATITPVGPVCVLDPAITLQAAQPGGVWSGTGITNQATGTFNPASANIGPNSITYTISGVCGDVDNITINVVSQILATINPAGPFCVDAPASNLTAVNPGGTWSGTGITNGANGTFNPATAGVGTHTITYITPGNCGDTSTVDIVVNALPQVNFTADVTTGCAPLLVNFTNTSNPVGNTVVWNFGDGTTSGNVATTSHVFSQAGCFDISLSVTSAAGCTSSLTNPSMICVTGYPTADFVATPQPTNLYDTEIHFTNTSSGAVSYSWDFAGLGTSLVQDPTFTFPDSLPGSYNVCLTAVNADGCQDSICKVIVINDIFLLFVPNAFTPDGNGKNEYFLPIIDGIDPNSYELYVFDRWGEIVFQTKNPAEGWNGNHRGMKVKQDVYVWKIKVKDMETNKKREFYGHVTLLR